MNGVTSLVRRMIQAASGPQGTRRPSGGVLDDPNPVLCLSLAVSLSLVSRPERALPE